LKIVLASKSPRRSEILNNIGLRFDVHESNFLEQYDNTMSPDDIVKYLSYGKAKTVAENVPEDALIIGADTIVVLDTQIMGKPEDKEGSYHMLKALSGKWHKVYTGLCVMNSSSSQYFQDVEITDVKLRELTDEEIWYYIRTGEPAGKAGSYAIQGIGSLIVERINGCYFNVVGLSVFKLSNLLSKFGIDLLKSWS
jgi:septum formation protein